MVFVETGVGYAFCRTKCLAKWVSWIDGDVEGVELGYAKDENCKYCFLCGRRCGASPDCRLHEGHCPDRDVLWTYGMGRTVAWVAETLGRNLNNADFDDCVAAYLERDSQDSADIVAERAVNRIRSRE